MTHRGKGRDLFNPFLVVSDLIPGRALLPKPKDPSIVSSVIDQIFSSVGGDCMDIRTYVLCKGWTGTPAGLPSAPTEVEKSLEEAIRLVAGCKWVTAAV